MRSLTVLSIVAAAVGLAATSARAESPFYVSGSVGGYFRESDSGSDQFFHRDAPTVVVDGTDRRGFDPGVVGAVAVGYRLIPHVRIEGELGFSTETGSTLNPDTTAPGFAALNGQTFKHASGDRFTRFTGEANVFYDFSPFAGRFTPYVGAGVGGSANHQTAGEFIASGGTVFHSGSGSSTEGFAMVEGGVSIPLTCNLSIVPAYRYVHYFADKEDVAHVVKVGLRYAF